MAEKVERLSPKHPDWLWLQSPAEQLMAERSAPFDSKVTDDGEGDDAGGDDDDDNGDDNGDDDGMIRGKRKIIDRVTD